MLSGTVAEILQGEGPTAEVRLDCGGAAVLARITRLSLVELGLAPGMPVFALVKGVALDRGPGAVAPASR